MPYAKFGSAGAGRWAHGIHGSRADFRAQHGSDGRAQRHIAGRRGIVTVPTSERVVDMARILGNLHTAAYQYIPALALPKGSQLNLRLNNPPSFRNPKSVLVVGLPAVEAAQFPPLRSLSTKEAMCLEKAPLVLPIDGAPLVFSTEIAHDFVLRIKDKSGSSRGPAGNARCGPRRICDRWSRAPERQPGFGRERDDSRRLGI